MFLRLIRKHPIIGLLVGLTVEAWIAVPGEALIATAAARTLLAARTLWRLTVAGISGMLVNDLALFGLSRVANDAARHWLARAHIHARLHLSGVELLAAKFIPPLRTPAFMVYGFQGTHLADFLLVSAATSLCWVYAYALLGHLCRDRILGFLHIFDSRGRLTWAVEAGLTVASFALLLRPF